MIYFIEGPRNVGKTFLLKQINKNNYHYFKNSYAEMKQIFNLGDTKTIGYQIGKDVTIMKMLEQEIIDNNKLIIIDRGFISSCVYSDILGRISESYLINQIKYITNIAKDLWKIIFVYGENPIQRGPKDFLDDMPYQIQFDTYLKYLQYIPKSNLIEFENCFDQGSIERFKTLL